MKRAAFLLLPGAFAAFARAELPPLDYSTAATYALTENFGRASGATDFHDVSTIAADFSVGTGRQLAAGLSGRIQMEAGLLAVPEYDRAEEFNIGPRAILSRKFGLGPTAPVLSIEAAAIGRLARIDENNGVTLQGAVTLSKRFTSQFSAQVRGKWQEHVADADTYDVHHYALEGRVSFDPFESLRVSAGGGYIDGNFTAGASAARFGGALAGALGTEVADYYASVPQTVTDTFGDGWITYRVSGEVDYCFVELCPALTDSLALKVRYERNHAVNIVDVGYRQDIFSFGIVYVF